MCGIVGYIGTKKAAPLLLQGLSKLEYRGYDSAGICVVENGSVVIEKAKGRLDNLSKKIEDGIHLQSNIGIGHTRWATHGAPSDHNSHPHTSANKLFTVVHNGIIENYISLKEMLLAKGYRFTSETDTEVIAHLLCDNHTGDPLEAIQKTVAMLRGSYALGIVYKETPDTLYAIRKESPLIVGLCEDGNFIASDIPAILEHTNKVIFLENNELVILEKNKVTILDESGNMLKKEPFTVDWTMESAEKMGFPHFMLKEIFEQPEAIRKTVGSRIAEGQILQNTIPLTKEELQKFTKIDIVACGSAYHVGVLGKYMLEQCCRISVEVDIASEFRYRNPILDENTLFIAISQSGETADTLAALREAKKHGATTLSIVNVVGSSLARESDKVIYTWAGPEISVATTKAYSAQLSVIYLLALHLAKAMNTMTDEEIADEIKALEQLPEQLQKILEDITVFEHYGKQFQESNHVFFLGRGTDYALGMEGSLKLKEISYLHSEAYAAGELKHGTISLIEEGTPVIALATQEHLTEKTISNIKEVKARGARVLLIAMEGSTDALQTADYVYAIPKTTLLTAPSLAVVPLQLIAYFVAKERGCDIDKPRNLAKSVTVE